MDREIQREVRDAGRDRLREVETYGLRPRREDCRERRGREKETGTGESGHTETERTQERGTQTET